MKKSYFKEDAVGGSKFVVNFDDCHWTAICQMYLAQYMLHMEIEKLAIINRHFLDNQDCIELIGEYAGVKKEWFAKDENRYRNKALEVIRVFHSETWYFQNGNMITQAFQKIKDFAEECFPMKMTQTINYATNVGLKEMEQIGLGQKQDKLMTIERWDEISKSYEADHNIIYTVNIRPEMARAVQTVNTMFGSDIIGMDVDKSLGVTEFVTNVLQAFIGKYVSFLNLFYYMYDFHDSAVPYFGHMGVRMREELEQCDVQNESCFTQAIVACLLIEQKLAQCHFHKHKFSDAAMRILRLLPKEVYGYIADPDPTIPEDWGTGGYNADNMICVCDWLDDLNNVIDPLVRAGLATNENLATLFGQSGYVSCRVWDQKYDLGEDPRQKSMENFITRHRIWREGCIDNDKKLGLKIKYLNKDDRQQRFEDAKKVMPMNKFICYLHPSLEQFAKRFGNANLGIDSGQYLSNSVDKPEQSDQVGSITKKRRCELDGFLTLAEACQHYFDSSTLEEAIWDLFGIPRIIVLDGNEEKMKTAGWKYCKQKAGLGDQSVQLGRRVAYVYSGTACTIWEEPAEDSS